MAVTDTAIPNEIAKTLVNAEDYATGDVHRSYDWLRANQPLGRAALDGFEPFWVVTKHADIMEISRQNALFHNAGRPTVLTPKAIEDQVRKLTGGSAQMGRTLVEMDAPEHLKYRALTQAWFMPQSIKSLEARIREIARASIERMLLTGGTCDFAEEVSLHFPLHVIMEILGVPESDEPLMLKLTQEHFGSEDPDFGRKRAQTPEAMLEAAQGVVRDFYEYFGRISEDRRRTPRNDLASVIANAKIGGEPISELDALSYYLIAATAGHDTTSSTVAGAMWALAAHPDEFSAVKADPSLIPSLVDEAIRWTTPVKHFMRTAVEDYEIRGQTIRKNDWLMLCYASGNRDEEVFEEPHTFRTTRKPNRHIAFGYGAHVCLGQHLAKMEIRIFFEELLPLIQHVSLAGQPKNSHSVFVSGPKSVPLTFVAA